MTASPAAANAPLSRRQAIGGGVGVAALAVTSARWLADACVAGDAPAGGARAALDIAGADPEARAAMAKPVGDVIVAAKALAGGIGSVGVGLAAAEGALAPLRDGVARTEMLLGQLEAALADIGLGIGQDRDEALAALQAQEPDMRHVIALLLETLSAVRDGLLGPLRASWLPDDGAATPAAGIEAGLFDPLHRRVLEPGAALVAAAGSLATAWRGHEPPAGDDAAAAEVGDDG